MSRDLTCNETLTVEDSERNTDGVVRRFPASSSASIAPFRATYNASISPVKYTIQKPTSKSPFLTTNSASHVQHPPGTSTEPSSDDSPNSQFVSATHTQLQNSNGPKLYKPVSSNSEYVAPAGVPSSQLQIFAGSALLRNAVAAAGYRADRPSSSSGVTHTLNYASELQTNAMQTNIYTTVSNMRLQQQPTTPSPEKSLGAAALATVQAAATSRTTMDPLRHGVYHPQAVYKTIVPQSQHQTTLIPRPIMTPPHVANRYSSHNGTKQSASPKLMRPQSAAHYVIPYQSIASPTRFITGHGMGHGTYHLQAPPMASAVSGSPGPSQPIQPIISTSSPRPSILRKRGDGSSASSVAKRRLPFMEETPTCLSTTTQTTAQQYNSGAMPPIMQLNKEALNGTNEESPRKRLRKQQFERDAIPEQIKMAIDVVQPIAGGSGAWKFSGDPRFITPGVSEKKKRGRPRANPRPATALPIELHQSVSVFVDIDSPEEKLKPAIISETSSISRGSTASVPPVHIEIPENDKVNAEEAQVTNNSVLHQASSCEGTQRKHVNKRKDRKNINNPPKGPTNLWRPKSSREADNDVSSKSTGTLEEQQHEVVTGFLASCLREKRSEQQLKQRTRELDPTPSGSKSNCEVPKSSTVFNNSASFQGSTMRRWRRRTHLANHFETIKEFHSKYEHFRKLKLMQHRGFHLSSNRGIRVIAEKCVEDCENNIASTSDILGFKPVKPISVAEKGQLISFVENVIRERLRKEGLNACNNFEKRNRVDVECRLPVVSCKRRCLRAAPTSTTSKKEGAVSSENADLTYIEQLLDEMVSFITRDQSFNPLAECAQRIFDRNATSRTMNLQSEPVMMGKTKVSTRSRAHMQTDTFTTILKNLKYSKNESRELSDNVFTIGPAYYRRSWWNVVASKKNRRYRGRKSLLTSPIPEFPKLDSSCSVNNIQSPETTDNSITELNSTSLREEVAVRLQHMNRQLSEQIRLEERILETFERFYEVYNPKGFFKMKLDMERDIDDGDSPETVYQKRMQRLRLVLNLPPGKLPADRKPDFGEQCASVISCPDENEMNRHMLGISPFWKGPLTKNNSKCFYLTRTGRRMHDKDESYTPLEDDYKEFYLEDLVDYRDPAVFRKDYSNMERIWTQLQNLKICPSESATKKDVSRGEWISRRRLARCKDNDEVVFLGSLQTDVLKVLQERDKSVNEEEAQFLKMGESTQEIFATAFKAVRQTTLMMVQTRNALLELLHNIGQNGDGEDEEDEQDESVDDEEDFNRQLEQAIQESCQEVQSTSKA